MIKLIAINIICVILLPLWCSFLTYGAITFGWTIATISVMGFVLGNVVYALFTYNPPEY